MMRWLARALCYLGRELPRLLLSPRRYHGPRM